MKTLGIVFLVFGFALCYYAFKMDTSVKVDGSVDRVNNIGLMNDKQNCIIFSGFLIIGGVILFAIGDYSKIKTKKDIISDMNFKLESGEEIIIETPANLNRGKEGLFGGRLILTNKRVLYEPHAFHLQTMPTEIPLEHIIEVKKNHTSGLIQNGLIVCTKSLNYELVVWGRENLINLIENQVSNLDKVDSLDNTKEFCSNCGKAYLSNGKIKFCAECGNKL